MLLHHVWVSCTIVVSNTFCLGFHLVGSSVLALVLSARWDLLDLDLLVGVSVCSIQHVPLALGSEARDLRSVWALHWSQRFHGKVYDPSYWAGHLSEI